MSLGGCTWRSLCPALSQRSLSFQWDSYVVMPPPPNTHTHGSHVLTAAKSHPAWGPLTHFYRTKWPLCYYLLSSPFSFYPISCLSWHFPLVHSALSYFGFENVCMCTKLPAQQKYFAITTADACVCVCWVWRPYSWHCTVTLQMKQSTNMQQQSDIQASSHILLCKEKTPHSKCAEYVFKNLSHISFSCFLAGVHCIVSCGKPNPFGSTVGQTTAQIIICIHSFWPGTGSSVNPACHNTSW